MAIPAEYKDIIEMLAIATDEGRVNWAATQFGLEVALASSKFALKAGSDVSGKGEFVSFALSDTNGKTLDIWLVKEGSEEYRLMHGMYMAARRKALGVPQRLDSIREEFKKSHIIGAPPSSDEKSRLAP